MEQSAASLFRHAAVAAQRNDGRGAIVLARPVSFSVLCGCAVAIAAGVLAFAYLGSYTAHSTLQGRVVPDRGVIEVASSQAGTILAKRVGEGERVAAGAVLYVVTSERLTEDGTAAQEAIGAQLARRRQSLEAQIGSTRELEAAERAALAERRAAAQRENNSIEEAQTTARQRLALAGHALDRATRMRALGFATEEQTALREAELLEHRAHLEALERERAALASLVTEIEGRAATLGLEYANERAELERAVAATELEIVENETRRAIVIVAPASGVVTGVVGEAGQAVERAAVLARIVPEGSKLVAELFAPSRAVGFIAPGDEVRLRYVAFPYQKFGHVRGIVTALSQATLAVDPAFVARVGVRTGPVYRVTVALESQTIVAYGEARRLLAGMEVEADVLLETRRLYEWVFEPLYALAGKSN